MGVRLGEVREEYGGEGPDAEEGRVEVDEGASSGNVIKVRCRRM